VREALDRLRTEATPERRLVLDALEVAYLKRTASVERAADDLAVSRTSLFRLLKKGREALAIELARQ
jgi:predicted DNA-binding protein (UPF0251 family)